MLLDKLGVASGCAIIAAVAHTTVISSGGYSNPVAQLQIAVALGICVGSVCVGAALRDRRWLLALLFIVALVAGEGYALVTTSEATISSRDAAAAPLEAANKARAKAETRVETAEGAKAKADAAAISEAAKPGCKRECRVLLEGAKADAQRELEAARTALERLLPARSASPLADSLGVDGWALDLIAAALRSIAVNGLGAALIAFGAHGSGGIRRRQSEQHNAVVVRETTAREHALRFSREMLAPAEVDTPLATLHTAYLDWCQAVGERPFATREIGAELAALFQRAGIEVVEVDGMRYVSRARLLTGRATFARSTALGSMATLGAGA